MERHVMWAPWDRPGLEHLHLLQTSEGVIANGLMIGVEADKPFRLQYEIHCDARYRVRKVSADLFGADRSIQLTADGDGHWFDRALASVSALDGCMDVDISVAPFTNTLPIRRLSLKPGESSELLVVYLAVPEMQVTPVRQRYTCLELGPTGGVYKYESLWSGFSANLPIDADGLVVDYPQLVKRVWPA